MRTLSVDRAGRFIRVPAGYSVFLPRPLPPDPSIDMDSLAAALSRADQAVGRLDGVSKTLLNPDLFVAMYVRREAVLSSQIEGTQSTLEDVLAFELDPQGREQPQDVKEVVNYVRAMDYGLKRLENLPLSLRLIREIHAELLKGVRGASRRPGEFRNDQNWIGPPNSPISAATFVPPPPPEMGEALTDLERFLHEDSDFPVLIECGMAHAQFETIHPFLDGNGRVGRLLITFLLVHRGVLQRPLLYLSHFLKRYRDEYYGTLQAVRDAGDWEGWLRFFLRGVTETAAEATATAGDIVDLRERSRIMIQERRLGVNGLRLLDLLFRAPLVSVSFVEKSLGVSFVTANRLAEQFQNLDLLMEITGGRRNRRYRFGPYLKLFEEDEAEPTRQPEPGTTQDEQESRASRP